MFTRRRNSREHWTRRGCLSRSCKLVQLLKDRGGGIFPWQGGPVALPTPVEKSQTAADLSSFWTLLHIIEGRRAEFVQIGVALS
jgi:hypothetical protein